ncbi:MAG: glycerol-3-phosphate dehydrogenase C-terminal domain-containing protein, partial [Thermoguttaceae bacterium]
GGMITEVLELVDADRSLAQPVSGDYLGAEIVYAVTHEGALHLEDILTRRTHISIETVDRGSAGADKAARLVAPLLGWDRSQIAREVARYRTRVDAEIESQRQPDDAAANATRIGAPDSREIARTTLAHA